MREGEKYEHADMVAQLLSVFLGWMRIELVKLFERLCLLCCWTDAHFAGHGVGLREEVGVTRMVVRTSGGRDKG